MSAPAASMRFVRFRPGGQQGQRAHDGEVAHGSLGDDGQIAVLEGDPVRGPARPTEQTVALAAVSLLVPCRPEKILAVGRNYRSHLGTREAPRQPEMFWKPVSALQDPEAPIVLPAGSTNVHFEGELVLVIGRRTKNASLDEARAAIFGVTCGNDVSEREWQSGPQKDLQWWRAKGSDTFAPCGPVIATGLDFDHLPLQTRVNGQVLQQQTTADMLFDCARVVSYVSQYVTLAPGDLIYTGTPGNTGKLSPGDVVEVEIDGIGLLRNPVVAGVPA